MGEREKRSLLHFSAYLEYLIVTTDMLQNVWKCWSYSMDMAI